MRKKRRKKNKIRKEKKNIDQRRTIENIRKHFFSSSFLFCSSSKNTNLLKKHQPCKGTHQYIYI